MPNPNKSRHLDIKNMFFCVSISILYVWITSTFLDASAFLNILVLSYIWTGYMVSNLDHKYTSDSIFTLLSWPVSVWKAYDLDLQKPRTGTHNAYVNDVYVGNISDTDLYLIKRKVLRNPVIYLTQLGNVFRVLFISLDRFLLAIPIFTFWAMLWLGYAKPTVYTQVLSVIQNNPLELTHFIGNYFSSLVAIFYMFLLVHFALLGRVPGFDNKFSAYTALLLRQKLGVAAEGKISLTRPLLELMTTE